MVSTHLKHMLVKLDHFPQGSGWKLKKMEPAPRFGTDLVWFLSGIFDICEPPLSSAFFHCSHVPPGRRWNQKPTVGAVDVGASDVIFIFLGGKRTKTHTVCLHRSNPRHRLHVVVDIENGYHGIYRGEIPRLPKMFSGIFTDSLTHL